MKQVSMVRVTILCIVTLLCLYLIFPTARYLLALRDEPEVGTEAYAEWEERTDALRERAIPLGLDLRGGVDVTLRIDPRESMTRAAKSLATSLRREFADKKLSVDVADAPQGQGFTIQAHSAAEARQVRNILLKYEEEVTEVPSESELASQREILIGMDQAYLERNVSEDIRGAEKVVRERLDTLGLAQPSIAIQGNNQIRVQIAGEKNPDKVIENITKLALMEFRLAHPDHGTQNNPLFQMLDETGEVRPDAQPPLGYEIVDYKFGSTNPNTGLVEYSEGKMLVEEEVQFTGENLRSAGVIQDQSDISNPIKVSLQLDSESADIFANMTRESVEEMNRGGSARHLAILLDGVVRSAPVMQRVITGGSATIEGGFTFEEAVDLSQILKAGSLRAPLAVESKHVVGASLGTESIFDGVQALFWGGVVVVVFMILYYQMAGVISVIALTLNVGIILAIMALADATLTLSGIGGILLTIGMAVDANVLIYERIREEVDAGRPLRQAINIGFDKAFSVILDSNLTTLLTAFVLLQFSEGSVFGFALAMSFGLLANLYTGLTVTHTLCSLWFAWRGKLSLGVFRPFAKSTFDFIKARFVSSGLSAILLVIGLVFVLINGLQFGVDFAGGLVTNVSITQQTSESELNQVVADAGLQGQRIQEIRGSNQWLIRVKVLEEAASQAIPEEGALQTTQDRLTEALTAKFGADGYQILETTSFGPETGQGFRRIAISVIILASLAILFYLSVRFEFIFGAAAVAALMHDLFMTVFWSQIWGVEITLDVVAALLVLLGFSVNDTIVIFDRIREISRKGTEKSFRDICNAAMNQTLSRSLITSGTVFFVVVMMLIVGGEGLRPFAKVLTIGVISGSYSTIFIATPLVYAWNQRRRGKVLADLQQKGKPTGPEPAKAPKPEFKGTGGNVPKRRAI